MFQFEDITMRTREQVLFSTSNKHNMYILQYTTTYYRILLCGIKISRSGRGNRFSLVSVVNIICVYYSILQYITKHHVAVLRYHAVDEGTGSL